MPALHTRVRSMKCTRSCFIEYGYRQVASAVSVAVVAVLLGVPLWWKTTEVYRAPLPYDSIANLSILMVNTYTGVGHHFLVTKLQFIACVCTRGSIWHGIATFLWYRYSYDSDLDMFLFPLMHLTFISKYAQLLKVTLMLCWSCICRSHLSLLSICQSEAQSTTTQRRLPTFCRSNSMLLHLVSVLCHTVPLLANTYSYNYMAIFINYCYNCSDI